MTGSPHDRIRISSTPTNFGAQRVLPPNASQPDALAVLDAVAQLGYDGISLGPPGYLGDESVVLRERLTTRALRLSEAFLPLHFSRADLFPDERLGLRKTLAFLSEVADSSDRPLAVLSEGFREPIRWDYAGRAGSRSETLLPPDRFSTLIANLHRAAEDCRNAGFEPALHHHAGTFVETDDEIGRVLDVIDPSLLGMCLDTAHAVLGYSDPVCLVHDYHSLIRNVHVKDISLELLAASRARKHNLTELTTAGVFTPLGGGDAPIAEVLGALASHHYQGWLVIEQDRYLFDDDGFEDAVSDQRVSIAFLRRLVERLWPGAPASP